jgi:hypothetical protein
MGKGRKLYCVWENKSDRIIAIDLPAKTCAELMGIKPATFYVYATTDRSKYTIIESSKITEEGESA